MPYQCHVNTITVPYKPLTITYSPHVLHMPWHSFWETQFFEQMLGSIACKAEHTDSSISVPTHVIWSVGYVGFISAYYMKTIIPVYIVAYKYANNIYDIWHRSLTQYKKWWRILLWHLSLAIQTMPIENSRHIFIRPSALWLSIPSEFPFKMFVFCL